MAQSIILKRSAVSGRVPDTGSINLGEIAINTYDGKLYFRKSGSSQSVEHIITTNSTTTGSITLTGTGSFGEIFVTTDINVTGSGYFIGDIVGNSDLDVLGSISGSSARITGTGSFASLKVNDTLTVNHGTTIISGSQTITSDLTVLGAVNARQFNISIISSSTIYQSGSTKFGDTIDDTHEFTGSIDVSGSVTATSFAGDGSGLTNITTTFDGQTTLINEVDGNVLLNNSITDLFLQLGTNNYLDFDFNN